MRILSKPHLKFGFLGVGVSLLAWTIYATTPLAHELDIQLASAFLTNQERSLDERIVILDVPGKDVRSFRENLSSALGELSAHRNDLPLQVALDVRFVQPGTAQLEASIDKLQELRRNVVAVCPQQEAFDPYTTCLIPSQTQSLYKRFDAMGHTYFLSHISAPFYKLCSPIPSLVHVLISQISKNKVECADFQFVHMGIPLETANSNQLISFDTTCPTRFRKFSEACLEFRPDFLGKTILIGRISLDRSPFPERSGTELIGWALNDQLSGSQYPSLLSDLGVLFVILVFTVVLAKSLFWLLQRNLRTLRDKSWAIGVIAWIFGVIIIVALIEVINLAGRYYTMVSLPLIQLAIVLCFTSLFQNKKRLLEVTRQTGRTQYVQYDVFISYRSQYRALFKEVVLDTLKSISRSDGAKLNVFFDNRELRSGEFEPQLAASIAESRIFVACLTPNYFDPNNPWCRRELQAATSAGCKLILVMADNYDPQSPPDEFQHLKSLHHFNVNDEDFADKIVREIKSMEAEYEGTSRRVPSGALPL